MAAQPIPAPGGFAIAGVRRRNAAIDTFRGVLTFLVILGHFSEITQRGTLLTWFGSGFRMPVFIGLSGYLFNLDHARAASFGNLAYKYYHRLVLPWILACLVDVTITGSLDWFTPFFAVARPPFHLWFVPVLVCFIFVARTCRLDRTTMLAIAIPTSIAAMYIFGVGHDGGRSYPFLPDRRFFVYPVFFAYGMWLARAPASRFNPGVWAVLAVIGFAWWEMLYYRPSLHGEVAAELILSIACISLLPGLRAVVVNLPLLARIGRDSLFFYLWHPMAFGFWMSFGLRGWPMLAYSLLSLLLAWRALARIRLLSGLLGILPEDAVARSAAADRPSADRPLPARAG